MDKRHFDDELKKEIEEWGNAGKAANLAILENQIKNLELSAWRLREESEKLKENGVIAKRNSDNDTAKKHLEESIAVDQQTENELKSLYKLMLEKSNPISGEDNLEYKKIERAKNFSIIQNYLFLAEIYKNEDNSLKRQECCRLGLKQFQETSEPSPFVYFLSGCLYHFLDGTFECISEENGKMAIHCFQESIQRSQKSEQVLDQKAQMFSYESLGYLYQESKKFYDIQKAYSYFLKAEECGLDCKAALARYKKTLFGRIKYLGDNDNKRRGN